MCAWFNFHNSSFSFVYIALNSVIKEMKEKKGAGPYLYREVHKAL